MTVVSDILASDLVDTGDVAKVVHSSVRSVLRWQDAGTSPRRDTEDRLLELKAVLDLAPRVFGEGMVRLWLRSPVPALDYERPLELIAAGDWRRVLDVMLAFAEGVTA